MTGEALLATVVQDPGCAGILVNSALAEVSLAIDRATAEILVRGEPKPPPVKPWWRLW